MHLQNNAHFSRMHTHQRTPIKCIRVGEYGRKKFVVTSGNKCKE